MIMMCLGLFVFALPTAAFTELQRQTNWRHSSNSRIGARPANQFLGVGEETITLQGVILPGFGTRLSLDVLHRMADTGAAWVLVDGLGRVYGQFVITDKNETMTHFAKLGQPKKIEFSLSLKRVDNNTASTLPFGIRV
jgi:phage protein U